MYIYKTMESRKDISHSFILGFTKWLQCKSKFVNIWKITIFLFIFNFLKLYTMITNIRLKKKKKGIRDFFLNSIYPCDQELVPKTEKQALKIKAVKPPNAKP